MGGYNTFCEVLSLDKRALIVPRTEPRLEQFIRASRAAELGLISMLSDDGSHDPAVMAAALRALPRQNLPSEVVVPGPARGAARTFRAWSRRGSSRSRQSRVRAPRRIIAHRLKLRVAFVLKGYPRLSETFIAQEIAALERRGLDDH